MQRTRTTTNRRFDSLEQEVFLTLWRAYDRLHLVEEEFFQQYDLTPQQYNLLRLMRAEYPNRIPTLSLAQRLVSRAPDITRILDKLEDRGLIERERPEANRRIVLVGITAEGLNLLSQMAGALKECHHRQLGHLSSKELQQLAKLLREVLSAHEGEASPWT